MGYSSPPSRANQSAGLRGQALYAGATILCGTLPFEGGVPTHAAHLAGVPVFVAHGEHDRVIPRELLDRTWHYLTTQSGATTTARRDPVGHSIAPAGRPDRRTGRHHAGTPSGGCSSTRGLYSTSWMRPSKVRCWIISRATSG
ncbi:alpha/beta hydrolase [Streptomyces sp. NBC_01185]|uniref:alpha/beta hydrolase n=1 Tax=Streptomyces sp. NBC_01185 TaxID=2903764 RepID=UPI0038651432